jgi:hypothetical protein
MPKDKDYDAIFSNSNFVEDIMEEVTELLRKRELEGNKWYNADGTEKKHYMWKYASKTKQGDAGESMVRSTIDGILSEIYGSTKVETNIVNKGKGDFDILITFLETGRTIKIEVKTATEDTNGSHQFNGLKKVNYDYAFLFGVGPEKSFFAIHPYEELTKTLTTNMSKGVFGSYKKSFSQKLLTPFNARNLHIRLEELGIVT